MSFTGKKNIYVCDKCEGHVVTVDIDDGTTPFIIACKATPDCKGRMQSSLYRVFDQRIGASHEWYRPAMAEVATLGADASEHVSRGGLLLRKREAAA